MTRIRTYVRTYVENTTPSNYSIDFVVFAIALERALLIRRVITRERPLGSDDISGNSTPMEI